MQVVERMVECSLLSVLCTQASREREREREKEREEVRYICV